MNKVRILLIYLLVQYISNYVSGNSFHYTDSFLPFKNEVDSIPDKQILYNGRAWSYIYLGIDNDPFLFTKDFVVSSVTIMGKTFNNVQIKYDICNDEIIARSDTGDLLQLNKEMIDSFSIMNQGKIYQFVKLNEDYQSNLKGFINVIYNGNTILYLKYSKEIHYSTSEGLNSRFVEKDRLYLVKDGRVYYISKKGDIFKILNSERSKIREFTSGNKTELSIHEPESFIPLLRSIEK
jgi:hypothetical protein